MQENSDTQNSEGFIPENFSIDNKVTQQISKQFNQRPIDWCTRYLSSTGCLRQTLQQCYEIFQQFLHSNQISKKIIKSNQKIKIQSTQTIYQKYFNSNWILIYLRGKQANLGIFEFKNKQQFSTNNMIQLNFLKNYYSNNYSIIKNFQNKQNYLYSQTLQFDSQFQSGNLYCVFQDIYKPNQYTLLMQDDTNTKGYNQWFYFSIQNAKVGVQYKLNIVNFRKSFSFFQEGMLPVTFSKKESQQTGNGWAHWVTNINYKISPIHLSNDTVTTPLYMLSFNLQIKHPNDYMTVSMLLPYTYSRLIKQLDNFKDLAQSKGLYWNMENIGYSLANNQIPYITITSPSPSQKKKIIFILARQHPGQTWSSFLMQYLLHELVTIGSQESKWLLQNYIFKIIPMVNVDGVIYGNFRCDLTGSDLNRCWKQPSQILHPQIYRILQQIRKISQTTKIQLCFDLHGHSKQYNIFCYSCKLDKISCRVLPYIFHQINSIFHFPSCTFGISKQKQKTARGQIYKTINNVNVLTIQSSFMGYKCNGKKYAFNPIDFHRMASSILKGSKIYLAHDNFVQQCEQMIKKNIKKMLTYEKQIQSGSDSDPQIDQINLKEEINLILPEIQIKLGCEDKTNGLKIQNHLQNKIKTRSQLRNHRNNNLKNIIGSRNNNKNKINDNIILEQNENQLKQIKHKIFEKRINISKRYNSKIGNNLIKTQNMQKKNKQIISSKDISSSFKIPKKQNKQLQISLPSQQKNKKCLVLNQDFGYKSFEKSSQLIPIKVKNHLLYQFWDRTKESKEIRNSKFKKNTKKITSKQLKKNTFEDYSIFKDGVLCIYSESAKKIQQKDNSEKKKEQEILNKKLYQLRKKPILQKASQHQYHSNLITQVWRQNFIKYGKQINQN